MKPMRTLLVILSLVGAAAVALFAGPELRFPDFIAVYAPNRALWHGIDLYDHAGRERLFGARLIPYGYPPWYALTTAWLGLLQQGAAGRLWMLANIAMLVGIVAALTRSWTNRSRAFALVAATAYVPTLILLFLGQFTLPVVLGAALLLHASRGGAAMAGGFGLALLTFKPHLGALVAMAALPWLVRREGRAVLVRGGLILALLAAASFAIAPRWPTAFPEAAVDVLRHPLNVLCKTCSSASFVLARTLGDDAHARTVAGVIFLAMLALIAVRRPDPSAQIAIGAIAATLLPPYMRNYDYVLLMVPLAVAWERTTQSGRALLVVAWLLPWVTLAKPGASSLHSLWVSAVIVLVVLLRGAPGLEQQPSPARPLPSTAVS